MLTSVSILLQREIISQDDIDDVNVYYIINPDYILVDKQGCVLFSIQDVDYDTGGSTVLVRDYNVDDPINLPIGDFFNINIFKKVHE